MRGFLHVNSWCAAEKKSSLRSEGSRSVVFNFRCLLVAVCENKRRHLKFVSEKRADSVVSAVKVLSPKPVTTNTVSGVVKDHR